MTTQPIYNFCAGPATLPREVMEATAEACRQLEGTGLSLMETSHRSPIFQEVLDEARQLLRELLHIPSDYTILLLSGGASMEFCRIPANLLRRRAAYVNTGVWASKAQHEAQHWGEVVEVASTERDGYDHVPSQITVPSDIDYVHYTSNNTIYGTEFLQEPEVNVPLVSDMSSDILSRPIQVERHWAIYGGAQKNLSMAGLSFVILSPEALAESPRPLPSILDYRVHREHGGLFHTPPVVPIFCARQMLRWIKSQGGVPAMERMAIERSRLLYEVLDESRMFRGMAHPNSRSRMNICFRADATHFGGDTTKAAALEAEFIDYCAERDVVGIKGHRLVGGLRASCYNGMPLRGAERLAECMREFESEQIRRGRL